MRISVVTVAYNAAGTIGETVRSVAAQDWADVEHLVVDGASPDGTADVAREMGARVISEPDRGLYDAMNKGLRLFTGDAVGFLNADDRFASPGVVRAIAGALEGADAVHGDLDFVDAAGRVARRWRATDWQPGAFRRGWMPAHPTFYLTRARAEATGFFDPGLSIAADYEFMLRALELRPSRVARLEMVMVAMRMGGASTAGPRAYLKGNLQALAARRRWLGAGVVDRAFLAKPLGKLGQWIGG